MRRAASLGAAAMGRLARVVRRPKAKPRGRGRSGARRRLVWRRAAVWSVVAVIWCGVIVGGVVAWYAIDLPPLRNVEQMTRRPNITILSADDVTLASLGDRFGRKVTLAEVPAHLPHAVLAIEDRRYYEHGGLDYLGVLRALVVNLWEGDIVQGGSTLTQQLAKNLFLSPDRTAKRKIQELLLAFWLERKFTKDEILTIYLNRVYLGAGAYGVDAAARTYFAKPARELGLLESAMVAGLLKAPSRLNPLNDRKAARQRAHVVLGAMVEAGFITEEEAAAARAEPLSIGRRAEKHADYFVDWVLAQVRDFLGEANQDIRVFTTLDSRMQEIAEDELTRILEGPGAERDVGQAALLSIAPDGATKALVGGRDYGESQFNRVTQALRQPGSAFKPFVYLTALESGMTPQTRIQDAPVTIGDWSPENYSGKYHGNVTLREAFAGSYNSVAARLINRVGPKRVVETARRLGITSELEASASLALGASEVTLLELVGAYGGLAGGQAVWPYGIREIRDGNGRLLFARAEEGSVPRTIPPRAQAGLHQLMRAVVTDGTGRAADPGRPAAGKTGTSQDFRDALFVGFTAELVTGVWMGNDDDTSMQKVTGGSLPAQLWGTFMTRALEGTEEKPLPTPEAAIASADPAAPAGQPAANSASETAREGVQEVKSFIGRVLDSLGGGGGGASRPAEKKERTQYGTGGPMR